MRHLGLLTLVAFSCTVSQAAVPNMVDFNRDVRPILSDNCFHCHGPDKNHRKAGLRLDTKEGLLTPIAHKRPPVVPGKPDASEVIKRITTTDEDDHMPPEDSGKKLTVPQIAVLKRWIEQGAVYQGHWSYEKLVRPGVPSVGRQGDKEAQGQGDKEKDQSAIGNPQSAIPAIRNPIDAFVLYRLRQQNLAFSPEADRATLARRLYFDLLGLPPTPAQVDAFVNDKSERAYENLVERLLADPHFGERMAVYWLDLVRFADTIGYHSDNPRDIWPYRDWVIAAFNSNMRFDRFTREQLAGDLVPNSTTEQKVASAYNRLLQTTEEGGAQPKEYAAKYLADRVRNVSSVWLAGTMICAECHDHKFDPYTMKDFYSLASFFADVKESAIGKRGDGMLLANEQQKAQLAELEKAIAQAKRPIDTPTPELQAAQAEWEKAYAKNKAAALPKGGKAPDKNVAGALAVDPAKRTPAHKNAIAAYYRSIAPSLEPARQQLAKLEGERNTLRGSIPKVHVSESQAPAVVRILPRGNWNTDSGEIVTPAVPHFLPQIQKSEDQETRGPGDKATRLNRLDLANWLMSRENPLTARVYVNRLWKLYFGTGISKTLEDLGSQGEWPTHPELLDWLAAEFQDCGWDTKHMIRLIVTSSAYRQSSFASAPLREIDPFNRLVARQARFRLDAEFVRDNALSISGLLVDTIGGPSVRPYQPDGYWDFLNFPKRTYSADTGVSQYRRGLYTWWQRTFPQPSLVNFDAPSREESTCERPRSNTPQQALTLLNDPTYVEAARVFAQRILAQPGGTSERITWGFRQAVQRSPKPRELSLLAELHKKHRQEYSQDAKAAESLIAIGQSPRDTKVDPAELAAWTSVARAMLNLHETITRN